MRNEKVLKTGTPVLIGATELQSLNVLTQAPAVKQTATGNNNIQVMGNNVTINDSEVINSLLRIIEQQGKTIASLQDRLFNALTAAQ